MVEAQVNSVMKKKEGMLDSLINTYQQQLDQGASLKKLETRMMTVTEKAEKVLAHLNEAPTPPFLSPTSAVSAPTPPLADTTVGCSHLEVKNVRTLSQTSLSAEDASVSEFMENTRKQFERLHAENAALKAAFEDIRERTTPSPTIRRQTGVIEGLAKLMHIKKEPVDPPEDICAQTTMPMKRTKEEFLSPEADRNAKRIKSEPVEMPYPPLPQLPIPECVPSEAARYNLPPRLKVDLALIKNPSPQLSVVWSQEVSDYCGPPMDTYSVFFTAEQVSGCGFFEEWQNLGEHSASSLPMFSLIPEYRPGHKICVTVVGKDRFGRYGPFSKVACAYI